MGAIDWTSLVEKPALTYNSGWINFETAHAAGCLRLGKTVFLSGLFGRTTNIGANQTILTLPEGFRPSATRYNANALIFQTAASQSTPNGTVSVNSDGLLVSRVAVNAGQWVSVTGVEFVTD